MNIKINNKIISHILILVLYLTSISVNKQNKIFIFISVIVGPIILFYIVGDSLNFVLKKYFKLNYGTIWGEFSFIFLLSFSYLMFVSLILCIKYMLNSFNLSLIIIISIIILDLFGLTLNSIIKIERNLEKYIDIFPTIPIIIFGLLLAIIFLKDYKWPSIPGWDIYVHLGNSNWIINHNGTNNIIPNLGDVLVPYPYLFHMLVSSISLFIHVDPFTIFWAAPYFTIPYYGVLVYSITYVLNNNRMQAFLSALIALTIYGGGGFLGPQYFYTSTMSLLLFLNLLIFILDIRIINHFYLIIISLFTLIFYFFYPFPIVITFPIIAYFILSNPYFSSKPNLKLVLIYRLSLIGMILISFIYNIIVLSKRHYLLIEKINLLRETYIDAYWIVFIIGCFYILFNSQNNDKYVYKRNMNLLTYVLSLLLIYLMPHDSTRRVELYFRSFIAIISSFSIVWINNILNYEPIKIIILKNEIKITFKKINLVTFVFIIFLISFLIQPYLYYSDRNSNWSNLSKDEYQASKWIKENSPSTSYILTDPSTGKILRGFTTRNCSTWFMIRGQSTPGNFSLKKNIYEFFREENPLYIDEYIKGLPQNPYFIVITTRTSSWIRGNINKTYCGPTSEEIKPFLGISKFSTPFFTLVKSFDTVDIYRPSEAKLEAIWVDDIYFKGSR